MSAPKLTEADLLAMRAARLAREAAARAVADARKPPPKRRGRPPKAATVASASVEAQLRQQIAALQTALIDARAVSYDLRLPTGETSILCPCCGHSAYLHHEDVNVYSRGEDDTVCLHTTVSRHSSSTSMSSGKNNPSRRRHGLTIDLWCELCEASSRLELAQHKGQTTVTHLCVEPAPSGTPAPPIQGL